MEAVKVYRMVDGQYERTAELSVEHGDSLTTPLLTDLALPLSSIFELP